MTPPVPSAESGYVTPVVSPLRPVMRLGWRLEKEGLYFGLTAALIGHAGAIFAPYFTMWMIHLTVVNMNKELTAYYKRELAVDVVEDEEEKKEDPPPPPEPEPEPEPVVVPKPLNEPVPQDDPDTEYPDEPPPAAAAAAGDVISAEGEDMTGEGWDIVDSDDPNTIPGSGMSTKGGTSKKHVTSRHAQKDGVDGGKGKSKRRKHVDPEPKENLSRGAVPRDSSWNCPFPPQADLHQIHKAVASVSVTVGPDGRPTSATTSVDPGYGFGANARRCAMTKTYVPALDKNGKKITQTIVVNVNFRR
jgi:periplasmic protein TonB